MATFSFSPGRRILPQHTILSRISGGASVPSSEFGRRLAGGTPSSLGCILRCRCDGDGGKIQSRYESHPGNPRKFHQNLPGKSWGALKIFRRGWRVAASHCFVVPSEVLVRASLPNNVSDAPAPWWVGEQRWRSSPSPHSVSSGIIGSSNRRCSRRYGGCIAKIWTPFN